MKRLGALILVGMLLVCLLSACGSDSGASTTAGSASNETVEKEYIDESQIDTMLTNPDNYKGKYVTLSGVVMNEPEFDEDLTAIQLWHDPVNYEQSFLVYVDGKIDIKTNDYVIVDGVVEGSVDGENYFGSTLTFPLIHADTVTKSNYIDVVTPTVKELIPEEAYVSQHDITLSVDKIEYAEDETRVYMSCSNETDSGFDIFAYDMKIIQDGSQYETNWDSQTVYNSDLQELSDSVLSGVTVSGVVIFPAIDQQAPFEIHAEGYSDDYELDFDEFVIEIEP